MSLVSNQRGSAVVEFVLVSLPLLLIFVSTISLTLYSYAKTVVLDATVEGARYAALADQTLEDGVNRTKELVQKSIGNLIRIEVDSREYSNIDSRFVALETKAYFPELSNSLQLLKVFSLATREQFN